MSAFTVKRKNVLIIHSNSTAGQTAADRLSPKVYATKSVAVRSASSSDSNTAEELYLVGGWVTNPYIATYFNELTLMSYTPGYGFKGMQDGRFIIKSKTSSTGQVQWAVFGARGSDTVIVCTTFPNWPTEERVDVQFIGAGTVIVDLNDFTGFDTISAHTTYTFTDQDAIVLHAGDGYRYILGTVWSSFLKQHGAA
jgi:hypothetical protein